MIDPQYIPGAIPDRVARLTKRESHLLRKALVALIHNARSVAEARMGSGESGRAERVHIEELECLFAKLEVLR